MILLQLKNREIWDREPTQNFSVSNIKTRITMFRNIVAQTRGVNAAKMTTRLVSGQGVQPYQIGIRKTGFAPVQMMNMSVLGVRHNSSSAKEKVSEITNELSLFANSSADKEGGIVSNMTSDQLGYLDSIGLAQGYGPTAMIERIMEYTHVYTGLPWWGTIITTTLVIRLLMFPLYVKASANGAKMSKIKPRLDAIMNKLKNADSPQEQVEATQERRLLLKTHDVHMSHQFFPMLQLPIAYGFFQGLRKMANFPVEGLSTQGYAWFEDLTQVDPYLGLQVISASVVLGMFKLGGETGATQLNPAFKKVMYALPIVSILITKEFSAAVVLYFAVNSVFSFFQTLVLRNKYFRKAFKIPAIQPPPTSGPGAKPQNLKDWFNELSTSTKESTHKRMEQSNKKLEAIKKRETDRRKNFVKRH